MPDPTYPRRPFLYVGEVAKKKGTEPKLVTLALRGVSILEFRNENSRPPSEEETEWAIWNKKRGKLLEIKRQREEEKGKSRGSGGRDEKREMERGREIQAA